MNWMGNFECTGRGEIGAGFWSGNVKEGDDLEYLGIERKTILKWILKNEDGGHGVD
jgi:hypothetical protein